MNRLRAVQSAPPKVAYAVYERDNYTCRDCGKRGRPGPGHNAIQAHHLVPYADGGAHHADNLVTLCGKCHWLRDRPRVMEGYREEKAKRQEEFRQWSLSVVPLPRHEYPPSYGQIAKRLGVSKTTITNWTRSGKLPTFLTKEAVESYADSQTRLHAQPGRRITER